MKEAELQRRIIALEAENKRLEDELYAANLLGRPLANSLLDIAEAAAKDRRELLNQIQLLVLERDNLIAAVQQAIREKQKLHDMIKDTFNTLYAEHVSLFEQKARTLGAAISSKVVTGMMAFLQDEASHKDKEIERILAQNGINRNQLTPYQFLITEIDHLVWLDHVITTGRDAIEILASGLSYEKNPAMLAHSILVLLAKPIPDQQAIEGLLGKLWEYIEGNWTRQPKPTSKTFLKGLMVVGHYERNKQRLDLSAGNFEFDNDIIPDRTYRKYRHFYDFIQDIADQREKRAEVVPPQMDKIG